MSSSTERLCSEEAKAYFYINEFIERHSETRLCSSDIKRITDKYRVWNSCYSKVGRDIIFPRKVLCYIVECMYRSRFQDSSYVELVLRFVFEMNKDVGFILHPTAYGFPSLLAIERGDFVKYFLEHAYRRRMLLDGYRLPCISVRNCVFHVSMLERAVIYTDLPILRQLLRFGAMFSYSENYSKIRQVKCFPHHPLFEIISRIVQVNPELLPIKDVAVLYSEEYADLVSCCKFLLKDFSQSSLDELHRPVCCVLYNDLEGCPGKESMIDFIMKFSANVIDDFQNHFIMPLSLKQISRLVIRRELNKNWALPTAIYQLRIPEILKIYLDV